MADGAFRLAFLLVTSAVVAVGGWIGYRATERETSDVCFFDQPDFAIVCMDPTKGESSFRVVLLENEKTVRTLPYGRRGTSRR